MRGNKTPLTQEACIRREMPVLKVRVLFASNEAAVCVCASFYLGLGQVHVASIISPAHTFTYFSVLPRLSALTAQIYRCCLRPTY